MIQRVAFWTILASALGVSAVYATLVIWRGAYADDYPVFWTSARVSLEHPELLYNFEYISELQGRKFTDKPWTYPPSTLLIFIPFASFPLLTSYIAFASISFIAFAGAARLIVSGWAFWLVLASAPVLLAFNAGQPTLLVAAGIIVALRFMSAYELAAGCLLGVVAAIKPPALIVAPIALMAGRHWRGLLGFWVGALFMFTLSWPFGSWSDWLAALPRFKRLAAELGLFERSVTPLGVAANLNLPGLGFQIVGIVAGVGLAVWAFAAPDLHRRATGLICGGLLCVPYAMGHEVAMLAPFAAAALKDGKLIRATPIAGLAGMFAVPAMAIAMVFEASHGKAWRTFRSRGAKVADAAALNDAQATSFTN